MLNVALPKGRLGEKVYDMFEKAGFPCPEIKEASRKLIFENEKAGIRYFWVKPSDVAIYVEHGAADIGIAGKDIPLAARILCIADSFDAMVSKRCYKPEMSSDYALHELQRGAGTQFDPELVQTFVQMVMDKKITPVVVNASNVGGSSATM